MTAVSPMPLAGFIPPVCDCSHGLLVHPLGGKCAACGCTEFHECHDRDRMAPVPDTDDPDRPF